tara:strand:- start:9371 stop:10303 length:933 start_codon:yes stop_codon:yes gene_type:complete
LRISVYITSFNKGKYLEKSIISVLNQSLKPYELIIVDDFSSDNSREIITAFKNRYPGFVKTFFNEQNHGVARSRNQAISMCKGQIITYLDGDDIFYENKIKTEYDCLVENANTQVVYSNFNYIDENDIPLKLFASVNDNPPEGNIFSNTFLRDYNVSSGGNYIYEMFYKTSYLKAGEYDENVNIWEDWDLRIRMSKDSNYRYCPTLNSAYRKLNKGLHGSNLETHYSEQLKIYLKNKKLLNHLSKDEKNTIKNKIYSRLKFFLIEIITEKRMEGENISALGYLIKFLMVFRMKKAAGFFIKNIFLVKNSK